MRWNLHAIDYCYQMWEWWSEYGLGDFYSFSAYMVSCIASWCGANWKNSHRFLKATAIPSHSEIACRQCCARRLWKSLVFLYAGRGSKVVSNDHCDDQHSPSDEALHSAPESSWTHSGMNEMADILQTTFSNAFSWVKTAVFLSKFKFSSGGCNLSRINQHWFGVVAWPTQDISDYLSRCWSRSPTQYGGHNELTH